MPNLSQYDWCDKYQREANRRAMAAADLAADAERGRALLRQLEASWVDQGYNAFTMGLALSDCWNHFQRAGWHKAQAEAEALLDEMLCKPGPGVEPACCPDCGYPLEVNYYGELVCGDCLYVEVA